MVTLAKAIVDVRGDDEAVVDPTGTWTWAEFDARANRCVDALRGLGHGAGTVALLGGNRHETLEIHTAVNHAGITCPPLNWHFTADELAYILENSGASALVADAAFVDLALAAADKIDAVRDVIVFGGDAPSGTHDYEALLAAADPTEPADQSLGTVMMYTSGTTGRPKGVQSSALPAGAPIEVLRMALAGYCSLLSIPMEGRVLINAPLYHGGPYLLGMIPFAVGNTAVLLPRFDAAETLRTIDEQAITTAYCVPLHFVRMLRLPDEVRAAFDGSSLRCVYHTAAPCPPTVKRQMIDWWGPVIYETYAATDAGIGTLITSEEWLEKPGSVGKAAPVAEILIVGEDGQPLGPNEVGTVYVRSLLGAEISYLGDDAKTASAHLDPTTVTVGDVGYLDEDGYLFLSDRKIDMIISGGVNIYPAEIEAHLITHPAVADVAVFGVPDEEFGEQVKAAVQLQAGYAGDDALVADLTAFSREGLAGFKVPRSFDFHDEFPRTETGKLEKRKLRDPYWQGRERAI
ncbi:MAG TPA: AMP-binding protein [Acidimicrobiales bacterium]|nr:AMP-binding protein [Acidimicrobiales bacterium]